MKRVTITIDLDVLDGADLMWLSYELRKHLASTMRWRHSEVTATDPFSSSLPVRVNDSAWRRGARLR